MTMEPKLTVAAAAEPAGGLEGHEGEGSYVDVKLHGISNLPQNWTMDARNPMYDEHPFRYEVSITIGGATATFTNGRILQALPMYTTYVEEACIPRSIGVGGSSEDDEPGVDGGASERLRAPQGETASLKADALLAAAPDDAPDVLKKREEPHAAEATGGATDLKAGLSSGARGLSSGGSVGIDPGTQPNAQLLWVFPAEEDPVAADFVDDPASPAVKKSDKRKAAGMVTPMASAVAVAAKPSLTTVPPCVVRLSLSPEEVSELEELVLRQAPLVFHFRRVLRPNAPAEWEDTHGASFGATIPFSMQPFAEPGAVAACLTVPMVPVTGGADGDAAAAPGPQSDKVSSHGASLSAAPQALKKPLSKKAKASLHPLLLEELDTAQAHPYTLNATSATISLTFGEALTRLPERRRRPNLLPRNLIPQHTRPAPRLADATAQFSSVIASIAQSILHEYRAHFVGVAGPGGSKSAPDAVRASFLEYFQASGALQACKEQLIPKVQAVIRERVAHDPSAASPEALARHSTELYIHLMDCVHTSLERLVAGDGDGATGGSGTPYSLDGLTPDERWKQRAREAEVMEESALAVKYLQARVATAASDDKVPGSFLAEAWCDLAEVYMRLRDTVRAEQSYREAITCSPSLVRCLLGYGALLFSVNRREEAAIYLHAAVDEEPTSPLVWGFVALLCDLNALATEKGPAHDTVTAEWKRESRLAIREALRGTGTTAGDPVSAVYVAVGRFLVDLHLEDVANVAVAKCTVGDFDVELLVGRMFLQLQQYENALPTLEECLRAVPNNTDAAVLLADCYTALGRHEEALECYQIALYHCPPIAAHGRAYVRLGNLLIGNGKYEEALAVFTDAVQAWPCGLTWLGMGIAYFRLGDYALAEEALCESNTQNNLNSKTLAYLAMTALRSSPSRPEDASKALHLALKCGLSDPYLLIELSEELSRSGLTEMGEQCLRRASDESKNNIAVQLRLASTLVAQSRLSEARELYEAVAHIAADDNLREKLEQQARILLEAEGGA